MKRALIIISVVACVVVLALSLTACNSNTTSDKLLLRNWSGRDVETFTYVVKDGADAEVGTLVREIEPLEDGYIVRITQTMNNGDSFSGYVKFSNTSISGSVFPPLESVKTSVLGGVTKTQKCVYSGTKLTYYEADGNAIPEDAQGTESSISAPYYDNMQFYTIIRGATFNNKFSLSFNVYVPNEKATARLSCALGATADVTYSLGGDAKSASCQPVSISRSDSSGQSITAYYSTADIASGDKTVKQALIRFVEGSYSYTLSDITVA